MKLCYFILSLFLIQLASCQTTDADLQATLASEVWSLVDPNEVDTNEEIQRALSHGVSSVIDLAIEVGFMPDANYEVTGIYSVLKQQNTDQTNYRFEVQVTSDDGQAFRIKCDVNIDPTTGAMDTYRWRYGNTNDANWDESMQFGAYDFLPDEVYLMDEDYLDAEEDQLATLDDGLSLLL